MQVVHVKLLMSLGYRNCNKSLTTENDLAWDIKNLFPGGSDDFVRQVLDAYPAKANETVFDRREAMIGDLYTNCPTAWILQASVKKNKGTWKLQFNSTGNQPQGTDVEYVQDPGFARECPYLFLHFNCLIIARTCRIKQATHELHEGLDDILRSQSRPKPRIMARVASRNKAHLADVW